VEVDVEEAVEPAGGLHVADEVEARGGVGVFRGGGRSGGRRPSRRTLRLRLGRSPGREIKFGDLDAAQQEFGKTPLVDELLGRLEGQRRGRRLLARAFGGAVGREGGREQQGEEEGGGRRGAESVHRGKSFHFGTQLAKLASNALKACTP
jgi:hypothetical protein